MEGIESHYCKIHVANGVVRPRTKAHFATKKNLFLQILEEFVAFWDEMRKEYSKFAVEKCKRMRKRYYIFLYLLLALFVVACTTAKRCNCG